MSSRMIFQVCLGKEKQSKLYKTCMESVDRYAIRNNIQVIRQCSPKLKIKPDIFSTNRSKESYEKHGGYLPIYEKQNAFDHLEAFKQIAVIDADIYINENAPNIFEEFGTEFPFGAVVESEMPINGPYMAKIKNYSHMQYNSIAKSDWNYQTATGFEFMNMGMMLINCEKFKPFLKGMNAHQWLTQPRFKDFIDGKGNWKWSTDQTLLNWWLRKDKVPFKRMDWRWNALYTALQKGKIQEAHFVHFFLKDKLPNSGENIENLIVGGRVNG